MYCASDHMDCSAGLVYELNGYKNYQKLPTRIGSANTNMSIVITNSHIYIRDSYTSRYYSHVLSINSDPDDFGEIVENKNIEPIKKTSISTKFQCDIGIKPSKVSFTKHQVYSSNTKRVPSDD